MDHADPSVGRYLSAIFVRIIAAHRGMTGQKVLGRKKVEKLTHLIEDHLDLDLGRKPIRAAAGPLDMEQHKKVCRVAEERREIFQTIEPERPPAEENEVTNPKEAVRFEPLERFDQAVADSAEILGNRNADVVRLINHLMKLTPASAEVVATLYAAWSDLIKVGSPAQARKTYSGRSGGGAPRRPSSRGCNSSSSWRGCGK